MLLWAAIKKSEGLNVLVYLYFILFHCITMKYLIYIIHTKYYIVLFCSVLFYISIFGRL